MAGLRSIPSLGRIGPASSPAYVSPQPPPPLTAPGRPPSDPGRPTTAPRGPELLHLGQKRTYAGLGPGPAPEVFTTDPHISELEWVLYWCHAQYYDDPKDARQPPFTGGRQGMWTYQTPSEPGAPRQVGNSVSDFVNYINATEIVVRLDTFHWHTEGSPEVQARDLDLITTVPNQNRIVRVIYDVQLIGDPSGAAGVAALADVLAGRELINPARSGLAAAPRESAWAETI
jgi:hypothetical protein